MRRILRNAFLRYTSWIFWIRNGKFDRLKKFPSVKFNGKNLMNFDNPISFFRQKNFKFGISETYLTT